MLLQAGVRQRVAVILNENARGVRRSTIDDLSELVPPHDLYISRSDAQILDDFAALGKVIDRFAGPLASAIGAAPRYALTVGLRSTPRFLLKTLPEIEIVNTGEPVYPIYWRNGRILEDEPIATGAVI